MKTLKTVVKEQRGNFGKRQQWPKISVICSVYNASKWLEGYLNALNNQFEDSFEVIFIDANSTDNSLEIIQKFDFRDGIKVSIIENLERISIYTAWNMGIREANGHYVMNWNTDDLLYPSALQTYTEYILRNPKVDLFYSAWFAG